MKNDDHSICESDIFMRGTLEEYIYIFEESVTSHWSPDILQKNWKRIQIWQRYLVKISHRWDKVCWPPRPARKAVAGETKHESAELRCCAWEIREEIGWRSRRRGEFANPCGGESISVVGGRDFAKLRFTWMPKLSCAVILRSRGGGRRRSSIALANTVANCSLQCRFVNEEMLFGAFG